MTVSDEASHGGLVGVIPVDLPEKIDDVIFDSINEVGRMEVTTNEKSVVQAITIGVLMTSRMPPFGVDASFPCLSVDV
jgi:hypothetical protein